MESFSDISLEPSCSAGCPQQASSRNNTIQEEAISTPAFCDRRSFHASRDRSMEYVGITYSPNRAPHWVSRETGRDNNDAITADDWMDVAHCLR